MLGLLNPENAEARRQIAVRIMGKTASAFERAR
jgi:hypothetical protein